MTEDTHTHTTTGGINRFEFRPTSTCRSSSHYIYTHHYISLHATDGDSSHVSFKKYPFELCVSLSLSVSQKRRQACCHYINLHATDKMRTVSAGLIAVR